MRVARADELRQEGHEEEHNLRISEVDEKPAREGAPEASARLRVGLDLERRSVTDGPPGKPKQIERAGDLDDLIGLRRGRQQS